MKILIVGYSGSGKSTLAKKLSDFYAVPVMYLDTIQFLPGWQDRSNEEATDMLAKFLDENDSWVIDGNYFKRLFERREREADKIIFLNFNRFTCLGRAFARYRKYKGKTRESMTVGCDERLNPSFIWWILCSGRTQRRKNRYYKIKEMYPEKYIELCNPKEVAEYLASLGIIDK